MQVVCWHGYWLVWQGISVVFLSPSTRMKTVSWKRSKSITCSCQAPQHPVYRTQSCQFAECRRPQHAFQNQVQIPDSIPLYVNEYGNFLKFKFGKILSAGFPRCDCIVTLNWKHFPCLFKLLFFFEPWWQLRHSARRKPGRLEFTLVRIQN